MRSSITLMRAVMQFYTKCNSSIFAIYGFKLFSLVFLAIFRHFHATHLHKNIQITKQLSAPALSWQYRWTCNFTGIITDSFFRNSQSKYQFWCFSQFLAIFLQHTYISKIKSHKNLVHLFYHGNADGHANWQEIWMVAFFEIHGLRDCHRAWSHRSQSWTWQGLG